MDDHYLTQAVTSFLAEVNTSLPGTVISFDGLSAVVKPCIDKLLSDGRICSAPEVISVPVAFPCGNGWRVAGPLNAGDGVLLVFSQRSLEAWLDAGDRTPNDPRMFSVTDAIAIPGLNPASYYTQNKTPVDTENLTVVMGNGKMTLTPAGKLILSFPGGIEVTQGDVQLDHALTVSSNIVGKADVQASGISLTQHKHPVSGNITGVPQ